mgnify:CR=1 FL=1
MILRGSSRFAFTLTRNLAAGAPTHASQMYGKNITTFLLLLAKKGQVELDLEDEIIRDTMITHGGNVVNERVCEALGIAPPAAESAPEPDATEPDEPPQDIYGVKKDSLGEKRP